MSHRIERVNQLIRQEVSDLLQRQVKDPRLDGFLAVTEVTTSPDMKYAKIYVSRICDEEEKKKTMSALATASGFIHSGLVKRLRMRRVPELIFEWDNSIERGARILELIDRANADDSPE
jgi:ribosome-binding factor A